MRRDEIKVVTKEQIQEKLDEKCMKDLKHILETPEGRRFFSWILLITGFNCAGIRGNSQDFYLSGRRSVSADLVLACNALGIEGMELRHKAEKEYLLFQMAIEQELKEKKGGGS